MVVVEVSTDADSDYKRKRRELGKKLMEATTRAIYAKSKEEKGYWFDKEREIAQQIQELESEREMREDVNRVVRSGGKIRYISRGRAGSGGSYVIKAEKTDKGVVVKVKRWKTVYSKPPQQASPKHPTNAKPQPQHPTNAKPQPQQQTPTKKEINYADVYRDEYSRMASDATNKFVFLKSLKERKKLLESNYAKSEQKLNSLNKQAQEVYQEQGLEYTRQYFKTGKKPTNPFELTPERRQKLQEIAEKQEEVRHELAQRRGELVAVEEMIKVVSNDVNKEIEKDMRTPIGVVARMGQIFSSPRTAGVISHAVVSSQTEKAETIKEEVSRAKSPKDAFLSGLKSSVILTPFYANPNTLVKEAKFASQYYNEEIYEVGSGEKSKTSFVVESATSSMPSLVAQGIAFEAGTSKLFKTARDIDMALAESGVTTHEVATATVKTATALPIAIATGETVSTSRKELERAKSSSGFEREKHIAKAYSPLAGFGAMLVGGHMARSSTEIPPELTKASGDISLVEEPLVKRAKYEIKANTVVKNARRVVRSGDNFAVETKSGVVEPSSNTVYEKEFVSVEGRGTFVGKRETPTGEARVIVRELPEGTEYIEFGVTSEGKEYKKQVLFSEDGMAKGWVKVGNKVYEIKGKYTPEELGVSELSDKTSKQVVEKKGKEVEAREEYVATDGGVVKRYRKVMEREFLPEVVESDRMAENVIEYDYGKGSAKSVFHGKVKEVESSINLRAVGNAKPKDIKLPKGVKAEGSKASETKKPNAETTASGSSGLKLKSKKALPIDKNIKKTLESRIKSLFTQARSGGKLNIGRIKPSKSSGIPLPLVSSVEGNKYPNMTPDETTYDVFKRKAQTQPRTIKSVVRPKAEETPANLSRLVAISSYVKERQVETPHLAQRLHHQTSIQRSNERTRQDISNIIKQMHRARQNQKQVQSTRQSADSNKAKAQKIGGGIWNGFGEGSKHAFERFGITHFEYSQPFVMPQIPATKTKKPQKQRKAKKLKLLKLKNEKVKITATSDIFSQTKSFLLFGSATPPEMTPKLIKRFYEGKTVPTKELLNMKKKGRGKAPRKERKKGRKGLFGAFGLTLNISKTKKNKVKVI